LLHVPNNISSRQSSIFASRRMQLCGGVILAVGLPLTIRLSFWTAPFPDLIQTWVVASLGAILLGFYAVRSMAVYPGFSAGGFILPAFAASYGLAMLACWSLRLDYSRFLFVSSFLISCVWFFTTFFLAQRYHALRIGVVPGGEVDSLYEIGRVQWIGLGSPESTNALFCDAIVADFRADLPDAWERFLADTALAGKTVYHVKQLRESLLGRVEIAHLSENSFGALVPGLLYVKLKRAVDFASALVALAVLLPVFALVALAIRVDSPGPILFRQRRIGGSGNVIRVIKFRTMRHEGSEGADERITAITAPNDQRITRVGRFLRRTRIDELPQVLNIIRGEMSWIGPRPEAAVLSSWYEAELPFYRYRHIVKPGITGWAQVNQGHVVDVEDVLWKLHYDFYYIKNFSPWLDVLITFKTIEIVFTGFGSR
jgi:lipopolysaccharide/colanic/teichoic acid biosynthesis glycosyltransferase